MRDVEPQQISLRMRSLLEELRTIPRSQDVVAFARAVQHGSPEHREWLLKAAQAWVRGEPLPECDH